MKTILVFAMMLAFGSSLAGGLAYQINGNDIVDSNGRVVASGAGNGSPPGTWITSGGEVLSTGQQGNITGSSGTRIKSLGNNIHEDQSGQRYQRQGQYIYRR